MNRNVINMMRINIFMLLSYLILSLFVQNTKTNLVYIDTPHITVSYSSLFILIIWSLIFAAERLIKVKPTEYRFDTISLLLLIKIIIELLSTLFNGVPSASDGEIAQSLNELIMYITLINSSDEGKDNNTIYLILTLVLLSVFCEASFGTYGFFGDPYLYKNDLFLPIGGSNAISAIINCLFIYSLCNLELWLPKLLVTFGSIIGVILTKSRGGMIALFAGITLYILKSKKRANLRNVTLSILFIFMIYEFVNSSRFFEFFSNSSSTYISRINLYKEGFTQFANSPIFGIGFSEYLRQNNPHNYILSILLRSGLAGLLLSICFVYTACTSTSGNLNNRVVLGSSLALIVLLIQGLYEIVLFSYVIDFFIIYLLAILMRENHRMTRLTRSQ